MAWLIVHIYYPIGFRNRAVVLVNWAWRYLRKDRSIRMITRIELDPVADELTALGMASRTEAEPAAAGLVS